MIMFIFSSILLIFPLLSLTYNYFSPCLLISISESTVVFKNFIFHSLSWVFATFPTLKLLIIFHYMLVNVYKRTVEIGGLPEGSPFHLLSKKAEMQITSMKSRTDLGKDCIAALIRLNPPQVSIISMVISNVWCIFARFYFQRDSIFQALQDCLRYPLLFQWHPTPNLLCCCNTQKWPSG